MEADILDDLHLEFFGELLRLNHMSVPPEDDFDMGVEGATEEGAAEAGAAPEENGAAEVGDALDVFVD